MPDINGIQSFFIPDVFPDTPQNSKANIIPTEMEGKTYQAYNTFSKFDFIDGKPANGYLRDAEKSDQVDNIGTQGSRIVVDGKEYFAQTIWRADVTFTFDNGHKITVEQGSRLFVLGTTNPNTVTGDVIVNPIDKASKEIRDYLLANGRVKLSGFIIDDIREDYPIDYTKMDHQDDDFIVNPDDRIAPICFASGVLIETQTGVVKVEDLQVGDMVLTLDNGYQPIRWIGYRKISARELAANPKLRPVQIDVGALGENCPSSLLKVSRQHRIMMRSNWAQERFGKSEVLVPAIKLVGYPGVEISDDESVTYYHVLLDGHEILTSNGAYSESLYLGQQALKSLSYEGREEIAALFPELVNGDVPAPQSRPFVERKRDVSEMLLA